MGRWPESRVDAFRQGLRDLGWVEGRNVVIEERHAASEEQRRQIAADTEQRRPDVIVACPPCAIRAAPSGSAPIRGVPIVFFYSDPVAGKMVESLARPGGNMTGLAYLGIELNVKRLQMLKESFPTLVRIGVLVTKNHALRERKRITGLTLKYRLPGIFDAGDDVEAGALMTYDTNFVDLMRRSASYVDRILKGAKPSDLPVEQPNTFEFAINLGTAKTMGLTIPQSVLLRANRVIE